MVDIFYFRLRSLDHISNGKMRLLIQLAEKSVTIKHNEHVKLPLSKYPVGKRRRDIPTLWFLKLPKTFSSLPGFEIPSPTLYSSPFQNPSVTLYFLESIRTQGINCIWPFALQLYVDRISHHNYIATQHFQNTSISRTKGNGTRSWTLKSSLRSRRGNVVMTRSSLDDRWYQGLRRDDRS